MTGDWEKFDPEQPPITLTLEWEGGIRITISITEATDCISAILTAADIETDEELLLDHFGLCLATIAAYALSREEPTG